MEGVLMLRWQMKLDDEIPGVIRGSGEQLFMSKKGFCLYSTMADRMQVNICLFRQTPFLSPARDQTPLPPA